MAIKTVSKLANVTGEAFLLPPKANAAPIEGEFYKDPKSGDVQVEFPTRIEGFLVLVLADGRDSRYPGYFDGSYFVSHAFPGHERLHPPSPAQREAEKKAAADKAAADKAAAVAKKKAEEAKPADPAPKPADSK